MEATLVPSGQELFSAKVLSTDPLYRPLSRFLAGICKKQVIISTREDYPDLWHREVSLDFGHFDAEIRPGWVVRVHHFEGKERGGVSSILLASKNSESNMRLIDLAIDEERDAQQVLHAFVWIQVVEFLRKDAWHKWHGIYVPDFAPSPCQQNVLNDAEEFFKHGDIYTASGVPYRRGIIIRGPTASGKHWVLRKLICSNRKSLCYLPVTSHTYLCLGPAIANVPLNSVIVISGLVQMFCQMPIGNRGLFLRLLESVFNTHVHDPKGFYMILLAPSSIPHELQRLWGSERFELLLRESLEGAQEEDIKMLTAKAVDSQLPVNVLRAFLFNAQGTASRDKVHGLDALIKRVIEERRLVDSDSNSSMPRGNLYC